MFWNDRFPLLTVICCVSVFAEESADFREKLSSCETLWKLNRTVELKAASETLWNKLPRETVKFSVPKIPDGKTPLLRFTAIRLTKDPARKGRRSLHESKSEQTGAALSAKGPFCTKPSRNRKGICTRAGRNHTKAAVKENSLSERKERAPPLTADEKTRPGSVPERVGAGGGGQADGFPQARRTERTRNHTSRRQALPVRSTSTSRSSPLRPGTKVW